MPVDMIRVDDLVNLLNELHALDPEAMSALCEARVPCNTDLADHPTVQVFDEPESYTVGIIGILNGLCGAYDSGPRKGWGALCAVVDENDQTKVLKFDVIDNEAQP